ncbi:hypothetical protein [Pseudonocardia sp. MH-G8]|uniref:hypothetical protein n=1 Tax=Pseudonocardia sp. MH-G8 TaxID=1854588 RepID=UPI0013044094|nr:hypothetical protein [Pseudonocardia sp. MH-G8]
MEDLGSVVLVPPIRPMAAKPAHALPAPERVDRYAFEPKFDGDSTELPGLASPWTRL